MAKKSFLKICETKPATKVLSIRVTEALHDRVTAATSLASALGYDFNLPNIFSDYLLSVIDSVERELAQVQAREPSGSMLLPNTLNSIVPYIADQSDDETEAGYSDEYVFDEIVLEDQS